MSILAVRLRMDAYEKAFGSSKNVLCMFKIIRMWRGVHVYSVSIREVFGKYSGSILGAYGMYGNRLGSMRLIIGAFGMKIWRCWVPSDLRTHRTDLEHDECFPNAFRMPVKSFQMRVESMRKEFGPF